MFSVDTCTVISVDDGLLRTSTGCADRASSLTLYVDWLNDMVIAENRIDCICNEQIVCVVYIHYTAIAIKLTDDYC